MIKVVSFFQDILLLILFNCVGLWNVGGLSSAIKIPAAVILSIFYLVFIVRGKRSKNSSRKMRTLDKGAFILGNGAAMTLAEIPIIILMCIFLDQSAVRMIINGIAAYLFIFVADLSGMIRVIAASRQVKVVWYFILLFTWYIPVVNYFVLRKFYKIARSEYKFEQAKLDLDDMRKENEICKTKYPILMVHGIFFRDWQFFNYWGRVPKELVRNGAVIFYGKQQSANTVEKSAGELAEQIKNVIKETGAEKVNIIAHSKGGLDSRYAISKLGMDKYVATLTTINTPHYGCKFVDKILKSCPQGLVDFVNSKYNKVFTKLGDNDPCFIEGVRDLTFESCEKLNREAPDSPLVKYHSVMSRMNGIFSAGFPLNLGYKLNKPFTHKGSDGLVTVESGLYGEWADMITDTKKRGISHGDVIDLMRENIKGFDVREYYVELVKNLKNMGY